ncbi:hypothetical protein H6G80_11085 [Nostoc sp. FACHB-87]|uniref:hypothetical protein n=1 Tax=Nostocales TaxID=1161 RepID=UPI001688C219|nr:MULTISPECIES: hypothetical protein [Nostocales]MBD2299207.1 hypothetical protein [Nostoc sp. FACHB-190]MBD2454624.1 hypothetical protein [Nostoc sp. FACHB-87]MBD2476331.1 hypothetical protein [Anabaena sp. FACHB-83]MBD2488276.1 hypothetical protein [Aulosira sp. FACHB-615]
MDELVKKLSGLGLSGVLFVLATVASGGSMTATLTLLSSLGGPLGLLGGLGLLGLLGSVGEVAAGYGLESLLKLVYTERSKTESVRFLLKEINELPITDELKAKLKQHLNPVVVTDTPEGETPKTIEIVEEEATT